MSDSTQQTADDIVSAAVKRITWAALDLLQSDPHQWSTRPCTTCNAITSLTGRSFGCVAKRSETAIAAAKGKPSVGHIQAATDALLEIWPDGENCSHAKAHEAFMHLRKARGQ